MYHLKESCITLGIGLIIVMTMVLTSCVKNDADKAIESMTLCYKAGGVEYQVGRSGGSYHNVCIFRKDSL